MVAQGPRVEDSGNERTLFVPKDALPRKTTAFAGDQQTMSCHPQSPRRETTRRPPTARSGALARSEHGLGGRGREERKRRAPWGASLVLPLLHALLLAGMVGCRSAVDDFYAPLTKPGTGGTGGTGGSGGSGGSNYPPGP